MIDNLGTPASPRLDLDYGYDAVGHGTSVADNFGVSVASAYDARDLLTARTWSGGGVAAAKVVMGYDGAGQRVALGRFRDAAGTQVVAATAEGYDAAGRLARRATTKADGSGVVEYRYAYNLAGEVTQEASHGVATDYAYDLAGQVVAAARPASPGEAYAYDAAGNAAGAGRAVGPMNRVASDAAFDYGYDDEGNLTTRVERATGEVTAFAYDHRDRLTGSERRSAGGVLLASSQYTYDVFDRLIVRTAGGVATATLYDGVNPWADAAGGAVTARYLYGDGADEVLARWTPAGGPAWYLADKQGTVRDVIDAAGAVVGTRSYDAFGRVLAESGVVDRFAFQGREWDAGAGLYQFRARWYDPVTRQFTSADPLGFAAGDWNTRRFVANNPLSGTDPTGMALADYVKLSATGALVGAAIGGYCGAIGAAIAAAADGQGWRVVLVQAGRGFIVGVILGAVAGSNPYGAVAVGAYGAGVLTVHPPRTTGDFVGLAVGFACGTVAGPRLSRWANGGAPKPGVKPPPEPEVAPPKGGCFVAGTLVLAEAVVLDADAAATPGLAEVIGDWLGTDDGRWAVAALLLAGLASRHVGGRRAGTPKPARGDDESEWIEDGGEGADEFGRWHWKR